jgi:mRNA interferase RelE/StbE
VIFDIVISRAAEKTLNNLDRPTEERIRNRVKQIAADPFDPHLSKALSHQKHQRSSRIAGWRILFIANIEAKRIEILAIGSRGQIYRGL